MELHFEIEIKEEYPIYMQGKQQLFFSRLISVTSSVLSKLLAICSMCETPIRDKGRQFNRINSVLGNINHNQLSASSICIKLVNKDITTANLL